MEFVYLVNNSAYNMKAKLLKFLLVFLLIITFGCESEGIVDPPVTSYERGDVINSELIFNYNLDFVKSYFSVLLSQAGVDADITPVYGVKVYKIVYQTVDTKGELIQASGSVFVPDGINNLPILSAHHGTQTKRTRVGSVSPLDAPEGMLAGTFGYLGVVPDYLGLGDSQILHPYLHAKSSATCVIDFIRAAKSFAANNNILLSGQLFLAGYSEGGYVTMAAHKEIETNYSNEFTVTASAPMAGSYDMNLTAHSIIEQKDYNEPSFLAFLMVSYNEVYGWNRINEIFQSSYSNTVVSLFDGSKTTDEINGFLTNKVSELFNPEFVLNYLNGNDEQFNSVLNENSLLNWTPSAPVKLFHGNAGEFVPYQNSVTALEYFNANGAANVELVTIENGTHATAVIPSLVGASAWFDEIRNSASKVSNKILAEY